jgi:DNA modification methylase
MTTSQDYEEQTYRIAELSELTEHPENPRLGDVGVIVDSIEHNGWYGALTVQKSSGYILGGNHRKKALVAMGITRVPIIEKDVDDATALRILLADNRSSDLATYDDPKLLELLLREAQNDNLAGTGYDGDDVDQMLRDAAYKADDRIVTPLAERFLIPPFSVFDARQGYWQDRKRQWISLGIQSELGRGKDLAFGMTSLSRLFEGGTTTLSGTSIFDPVLCEVAYRWFAPARGRVLDPFAGGSVRGVVAATLGLTYTGIDLAAEQLVANRQQWALIGPKIVITTAKTAPVEAATDDPRAITPVQQRGAYWFKRDDLFDINGATGGKARATLVMADGAKGLVTVSSRTSPQNARAARVAQHLGLPCRCHTGIGPWTEEVAEAELAGAVVIKHKPPRLSVLKKRAEDDAAERDWRLIPWGAVGPEAVHAAAVQTSNLPAEASRIIVPVGSGATLAGVLIGLAEKGDTRPVVGVKVGADPTPVLDAYAPPDWRERVELVDSGLKFERHAPRTRLEGMELEPTYEAKCIPFMRQGDLLWIVGGPARPPAAATHGHPDPTWIAGDSRDLLDPASDGGEAGWDYDLVFTCPPYADLETYSDDPRDISNMAYPDFLDAYREIIRKAVARLHDNRYIVWCVGDVRGPDGAYRGLVPDTIQAFRDAGVELWNEAILVNAVSSLPLRAARPFEGSRKLGRVHQTVLVFVKGDPALAHEACGVIEIPAESFEGAGGDDEPIEDQRATAQEA